METEAFNTELLIGEIEKRPAIWDMTSSDYSDNNLRRRAWGELVLIFCEGHDNEEKKKILCEYIYLFTFTIGLCYKLNITILPIYFSFVNEIVC